MTILFVAPETNLTNVMAEIEQVLSSGLDIIPLLKQATHADLVRILGKNDEIDGLWLATHGGADGVLLSDGWLSASALVGLVRGRISLVVLNTCESAAVAQMLQDETDAEVIFTLGKADDRMAYQFGARFASVLAQTGDTELAYHQARPGGNTTYLRLAGQNNAMLYTNANQSQSTELAKEIHELTIALHQLKTEVALLKLRFEHIEVRVSPAPKMTLSENQMRLFVWAAIGIGVLLLAVIFLLANGRSAAAFSSTMGAFLTTIYLLFSRMRI